MSPIKKSRVITAVFMVVTALLSRFGVKPLLDRLLLEYPRTSFAVTYLFACVLILVVVLSFEDIVDWVWFRFPGFRRKWGHFWREPLLEGWWVDVGIDTKRERPRIVEYSSITIDRERGDYRVKGTSWKFSGGLPAGIPWDSEHCELRDNKLTFWYAGGHPPLLDQGKADFTFLGNHREPKRFRGIYGASNFETHGEWLSLVPTGDTAEGAERYMRSYCRKHHFDEKGMKSNSATNVIINRQQWNMAFLRNSDKLDRQSGLAQRMSARLAENLKLEHRQFSSILDVGPGEGSLTRAVLEELSQHGLIGPTPSYIGVDPSAASFDSMESQLTESLGRDKNPRLRFVKSRIEDNPPELQGQHFDLILLLNVLYYVPVAKQLDDLAELLDTGGFGLSLHTNIKRSDFLSKLIENANPDIDQLVVEEVNRLTERRQDLTVHEEIGSVTIDFPEITDANWNVIAEGTARFQDNAIAEVTDLICFLVDKDVDDLRNETGNRGNKWQEVATTVHKYLRDNGNKIELPIVAQLLARKA